MKKVGVVGCGSMGRKHLKNVLELGYTAAICDSDEKVLKTIAQEFNISETYTDYKEFAKKSDGLLAVIISSDTATHCDVAVSFAKRGIGFFSEIPISDKMEGIQKLAKITKEKEVISMVGMIWRFHPAFKEMKKLLSENLLGKVYTVSCYGGEYLPDWHPGKDYKNEYSALLSKGGGVIITNISGIDYVRWLFGEVKEIIGLYDSISHIDIEAEDFFTAICRLENGIFVQLYSDFFQKPVRHEITVAGEKGSLYWDYTRNNIRFYDYTNNSTKEYPYQDKPFIDLYKEEITHFLNCVSQRKNTGIDLFDNIKTLEAAISLKKSQQSKRFVDMKEQRCKL